MNIAFFSDAYVPVPSGAAVSVETLRISLEKMGHHVYIFAPKYTGWKKDGIHVARMPAKFYKGEYRPKVFPSKFYTTPQIEKLKIDIVHTHYFFDAFPYPAKFAQIAGAPLITTFYRHFPEFNRKKTGLSSAQSNFEKSQLKLTSFANKSDLIVANSNYSKKYLKNLGVATDIEVVPIGIFTKDFISIPQNVLKTKYNIAPKDKILMLVSSIEKDDCILKVIKNFRQIWRAIGDVHLLIVGGGDDLKYFAEVASRLPYGKKITFTGALPKNVVNKFYGACDVLINPANLDPQPLSVIEALGAGTPVVTELQGAGGEFVTDNQDGFIASNDEDFYEKITSLLIKDNVRLNFSLKARINSQRFKAFNFAHNLLELYESEINHKASNSKLIKWKS
jgi:glycosyltransferase involved in cell wall biosynthesis